MSETDIKGNFNVVSKSELKRNLYVLVCSDGGFEPYQFVAVYDDEKMAEEECIKRNDYEERNYGVRSSWEYSVQKHELKIPLEQKLVFVLVFGDSEIFISVYDNEEIAEEECARENLHLLTERNLNPTISKSDSQNNHFQRAYLKEYSPEYSVKKQELNSNIWPY